MSADRGWTVWLTTEERSRGDPQAAFARPGCTHTLSKACPAWGLPSLQTDVARERPVVGLPAGGRGVVVGGTEGLQTRRPFLQGLPPPAAHPSLLRSPQQPGQKRPAGREYLSPAPGARHTVNISVVNALRASVCLSGCHMGKCPPSRATESPSGELRGHPAWTPQGPRDPAVTSAGRAWLSATAGKGRGGCRVPGGKRKEELGENRVQPRKGSTSP